MKTRKHWSMRNTIGGLRYIARSPDHKDGGFDSTTVQIARSALHHIERLRRRVPATHGAGEEGEE